MKRFNTVFLFLLQFGGIFSSTTVGAGAENPKSIKLKNCSSEELFECPVNSVCMRIDDRHLCVCLEQFVLNPLWFKSLDRHAYCFNRQDTHRSLLSHLFEPHERDVVPHSILLIILVGTLIVLVLWLLSCWKPIKRTENIYRVLKQRRIKRELLKEDHSIQDY